jgi:glycosyltransferase involved in cell wall biosynthesis
VYGRDVAVRGLLETVWRYGPGSPCDFFCTPDPVSGESRARDLLRQMLPTRPNRSARIHDASLLRDRFNEFDFAVWHDFDCDMQMAAAMRARLSGRLFPITSLVHVLSYAGLLGGWVLPLLLERLYPCDAFICPTESCKTALRNLLAHVSERFAQGFGCRREFPGELAVIPFRVDTELFRPGRRAEAREALGIPQDRFVIGWVGRISPVDKADLVPLLRVFAGLRATEVTKPLLLLAGSGAGPFQHAIMRCASDMGIAKDVQIISPLPPEKRADVHAALDVFTSPADNLQETAGLTPMEALASGVPQVVSDWDGYRETVLHGKTGFLIPTLWARCDAEIALRTGLYDGHNLLDHFALAQTVAMDVEAYRLALQTLLDNEDLRLQMGDASRRRASENFSGERIAGLHEDLWDHLCEVAGHTPFEPGLGKAHYDVPAYFDVFRSYPTKTIPGHAVLATASAGADVARGASRLPFYYDVAAGFARADLEVVLQIVTAEGAQSFEKLTRLVTGALRVSESSARGHLLWLLKYGMAECRL